MSVLPEAIRLGPLTLLPEMAGMIVALLAAILYAKYDANRTGLDGERVTDVLAHVVVVGFIVSRLSAFLVEPQALISRPLLTLLSGGIPYTGTIAMVFSICYFAYHIRQKKWPLRPVVDVLARVGVLAFAVYSLFVGKVGAKTDLPWAVTVAGETYHPIHLYQAVAAFFILVWAVRALRQGRGHHAVWPILFVFSCAMLFVSFFQPHLSTPGGLALTQWGWLFCAVIGYGGQVIKN